MGSKSCTLYSFLCAAKGNWRNSVYIECCGCQYGEKDSCSGFLMVPDYDGQPVVIPAGFVKTMTGLPVDKEECWAVISRQCFESLYALWLNWHINSSDECVLLQIADKNICCRKDGDPSCCFQKHRDQYAC